MRKIVATYVIPCNGKPIKNGMLVYNEDGTVLDLVDRGAKISEEAGVEFYSGILVPGFVNAHCHLELSHLHKRINEKIGMGGFLGKIHQLKKEKADNERLMQIADRRMWAAGIVVVGDISNSSVSVTTKLKSQIFYHTFIEAFGFHPSRAEKSFDLAMEVYNDFKKNKLPASLVPHSPYSVSVNLFRKIKNETLKKKEIVSIHNQESKSEAEFFQKGTGEIADHIQQNIGLDISHWKPTGKSSLQFVLEHLPPENQLLLAHNTFTQLKDAEVLKEKRDLGNTYLVLCPNANLYIENTLPPVDLFCREKMNLCLGTDSLASNHELSILKEMITIQQHYPEVELRELVNWACLNGARALKVDKQFGSFDIGKKPGVNLLTGIDFKQMTLNSNARVKRLI